LLKFKNIDTILKNAGASLPRIPTKEITQAIPQIFSNVSWSTELTLPKRFAPMLNI